jgi:hypothetical protein
MKNDAVRSRGVASPRSARFFDPLRVDARRPVHPHTALGGNLWIPGPPINARKNTAELECRRAEAQSSRSGIRALQVVYGLSANHNETGNDV